jgi:hypothetical protein
MEKHVQFTTPSKDEVEYLIEKRTEKKTKLNTSLICLMIVNLFFTITNISLTFGVLVMNYNKE